MREWQVQKSATHYTEAARDEIEMLQRIAEGPVERSRHCVRLLDSFDHQGPNGLHVCMVFEVCSDHDAQLLGRPVPASRWQRAA